MKDTMVTGRMSAEKKAQGARVLQKSGLTASQCINLVYDRLIQDGNADFLLDNHRAPSKTDWIQAAKFVDSLSAPLKTRFDSMTDAEIRADRLKKRKLM